MSQHTHDTREAVHLTDVKKLKSLHLEAKAGIDQHQNLEEKNTMHLSYCTFLLRYCVYIIFTITVNYPYRLKTRNTDNKMCTVDCITKYRKTVEKGPLQKEEKKKKNNGYKVVFACIK